MITSTTSGVWILADEYAKLNAQRWRPNAIGLFSWGLNGFGNLGQSNITYYSSPVQIPGTTWSNIAAGYYHTLATKSDGTLWAWGYNNSGQLAQSNTTQYSSPVQIPGTNWGSAFANDSESLATQLQ